MSKNRLFCFWVLLLYFHNGSGQTVSKDSTVVYQPFLIEASNHDLSTAQSRCPELIIGGILLNSGLTPKNAATFLNTSATRTIQGQTTGPAAKSLKPLLLEQHFRFFLEGSVYNYGGFTEFRTTLTDMVTGKQYYFDVDEGDMSRIYSSIEEISRKLQLKVREILSDKRTSKLAFSCFTSVSAATVNSAEQLDNTLPVQYISTQLGLSATPGFSLLPFISSARFCKLGASPAAICDSLNCDLLYTGYRSRDAKDNIRLMPFVYKRSTRDTFHLSVVSAQASAVPYKQEEMSRQLRDFLQASEELFSNDALYKRISGSANGTALAMLDSLLQKRKYFVSSYLVSRLPARYSDTSIYLKAKIADLQEAYTDATESYLSYLELPGRSENTEALAGLYHSYLALNSYTNAVKVMRRLTSKFPRDIKYQFWLGKSLFLSDSGAPAIKALERSVSPDHENAEAYYFLGKAYMKRRDFQKAESSLKKAIALDPAKPAYSAQLLSLYIEKTDTIFSKGFVLNNDSLVSYLDAISSFDANNYKVGSVIHKRIIIRDYEKAYQMANEYYQKDTVNNSDIFFDAAVWSRSVKSDGRYDSVSLMYAARYLKKDLLVSNSSFSSLKLLGSTYYRLGQYKTAIEYYQQARVYNRNDVINLLNIAEAAILADELRLGFNALDSALGGALLRDDNLPTPVAKDGVQALVYFYMIAAKVRQNKNAVPERVKLNALLSNAEVKKYLNARWNFNTFRNKVKDWKEEKVKADILALLDQIEIKT